MIDELVDLQATPDTRGIPIKKVGIRKFKMPVKIRDRKDEVQTVVATISLSTSLHATDKGTHISRLIETLMDCREDMMSLDYVNKVLMEMRKRLGADNTHLEFEFDYFIMVPAPISDKLSPSHYPCKFIGDMHGDKIELRLEVGIWYTSLCPCSKEISEYGAHNQRSLATVQLRPNGTFIWFEDIIGLVNSSVSCPIYNLLKRPDEKHVTEHAYENPKFVEDMVRDLWIAISNAYHDQIEDLEIEVIHEESIHQFDAFARIDAAHIEPTLDEGYVVKGNLKAREIRRAGGIPVPDGMTREETQRIVTETAQRLNRSILSNVK